MSAIRRQVGGAKRYRKGVTKWRDNVDGKNLLGVNIQMAIAVASLGPGLTANWSALPM
jgi:hypothetical protein